VTYRRVLDWMIGFIAPYTFTHFGTTGYTALSLFYTLSLGFSVFTSRILATDLSQSHCNFKSHMKSSLHSLIPFSLFLLNYLRLPIPELYPILILAAWDHYIASRRTDRKHYFLYCCEGVFTAPLHSNGNYSNFACLFVAAGMWLVSRA
jgi:hypothetical protein